MSVPVRHACATVANRITQRSYRLDRDWCGPGPKQIKETRMYSDMRQHWRDHLGRFGVWRGFAQMTPGLAASLEQLGFGALWLGSSPAGDLAVVDELLGATSALIVATRIVNMWNSDPHQVAASFARIESAYPGRFLLGVGAG